MEPRYFYTDAAGTRTGPFTETELERLAEVGGVDWSGSLELEGLGRRWRVTEVEWLADAMRRARRARRDVIDGTAVPIEPASPPPAAPPATSPTASPTTPPTSPPPPGAMSSLPAAAACSRTTYVLLGLLPALAGIFGIHNLVAGYVARGVIQLVLSVSALGGVAGLVFAGPCCCVGIPMWVVLLAWTIVEVLTVKQDAAGARMT